MLAEANGKSLLNPRVLWWEPFKPFNSEKHLCHKHFIRSQLYCPILWDIATALKLIICLNTLQNKDALRAKYRHKICVKQGLNI